MFAIISRTIPHLRRNGVIQRIDRCKHCFRLFTVVLVCFSCLQLFSVVQCPFNVSYFQGMGKDSTDDNKTVQIQDTFKGPPVPPPAGLCCMSGCQKCVWLDYADELMEYYQDGGKKADDALNDVPDENLKAFLKMELRMKK